MSTHTDVAPIRPDQMVGLEELRRLLGLSKQPFYAADGPAKQLPVVAISSHRRAVRWADVLAWMARNTRQPTYGV